MDGAAGVEGYQGMGHLGRFSTMDEPGRERAAIEGININGSDFRF